VNIYQAAIEGAKRELRRIARALKSGKKVEARIEADREDALRLISEVLGNWEKIAELLETALRNHSYREATIPIKVSKRSSHPALFLKFETKAKDLPHFLEARISYDRWIYKWEIVVDERGARLIERSRPISSHLVGVS